MEINQYSRDHLLISIFGISSGYLRGEGKAEMNKLPVSKWCSCRIDKIYLFQKKICSLFAYVRIFLYLCTQISNLEYYGVKWRSRI